MSTTLNASTSSGFVQTADTSGTLELQSNGTTQLTVASTGAYGTLKSATAVASTSGTSIDFTGIPSWAKRITVMFSAVSTNGTSTVQAQLGDSGGVKTTGYVTTCAFTQASGTLAGASNSTTGFPLNTGSAAAYSTSGSIVFTLLGSNTWVAQGCFTLQTAVSSVVIPTGGVTLSNTLDRVRITTVNGTDTFDAGSINIIYEG